MKVYLGADHRGFELKKRAIEWFGSHQIEFTDLGAYELIPEDDYNDYAVTVCREVLATPGSFGILLCGSAQGMCMQANRFKGIRAAFCHNAAEAKVTREDNDANVICIAADGDCHHCGEMVETFLRTAFLGRERYIRRNKKLDEVSL
ncbi:RpiB/LacA/LacB family sugar-phosphate isomerase [Candidatus Saccharibacteria bacterium]|nr:RpiB/LacA/LacB family sugar-phosphate isomerase [Candidatus Saccharibacteria bacterium]